LGGVGHWLDIGSSIGYGSEQPEDAGPAGGNGPWGPGDRVQALGDVRGKVLVDCSNPLGAEGAARSVPSGSSAGEMFAVWAAGARVAKAFNSAPCKNMDDPRFGSEAATMFLCRDDDRAKRVVAGLAEALRFEVCDVGSLSTCRRLEVLALLGIHLAGRQGMGPEIAFRLLKRSSTSLP
jgi:predicted dinucleotide-binding enzyme